SNARAGASGVLRCCSQSRRVLTGSPKASANSTWVMPSRCRSAFTGEIRRIFANVSGSSGWASGSERAAASTSSSVSALTRAQSVSPRGGASPGFTVSRVVPVLLIARGPPGRDDAARPVTAQGRDHEQDVAGRHTDDPYPFFLVLTSVDLLEPVRVLDRCDGIHKVDAVLAAILRSLCGIPLVLHLKKLLVTRSFVNYPGLRQWALTYGRRRGACPSICTSLRCPG